MYKGKFDQKNKQAASNIEEIVSQRSAAAPRENAFPRDTAAPAPAAPVQKQPVKAAPVREPAKPAPVKESAKAQPQKKPAAPEKAEKPAKRGPRLGGVIFYTLYFMFILVFFIGTYIGLQWLHGWLADYEAAQPTVKAEQVFNQLFTDPDWGKLYDSAGAEDSPYEGRGEYVAYMETKVGDTPLTYMETSAGLSGDKKYVVRLGDEKVASFTLVDKNKVGSVSLDNLENIADIPDWQLGSVEVFFEREGSYKIVKMNGHVAYVNNVPLDDSFTIQIATTKAEEYLPEGTSGVSMCTQQVNGLMMQPTVVVYDDKGNQMEVTYDEETRTFTERTESNTMTDEERDLAIKAAETNCLWMIEALKDRGEVAKYFDPAHDAYTSIVRTGELWMQDYTGYTFKNQKVTDYNRYSDTLFSVRVSMDLDVTRTNGTVKTYEYSKSMFFHKTDSGKWLVFKMTNVDVTQPVGMVRLTFMHGDTVLTSDFYDTGSDEIITPIIPAPEGKVLVGWITISEDEAGNTVYTLIFQPDETGRVAIPEGTGLTPMTLYAYFEEEGATPPAVVETTPEAAPETVPETTPETVAETVPATTEGA